jgi:hypothetical protein
MADLKNVLREEAAQCRLLADMATEPTIKQALLAMATRLQAILNVGDWFLDESEKDIAVPSQKMTWVKGQNSEWTPVVSMTKADVQNAPKQIFDPAAKKWLPAQ